MNAKMINTNAIYHEIINAPDDATRKALFADKLARPWGQMLGMMAGMFGGDVPQDETERLLAGTKTWHWLQPEQLTTVPDVLTKLETANAWDIAEKALQKGVACFDPYADRISFDEVEGWLMLADAEGVDPIGRGYTGATDWTAPRFVAQFDTVNDYNLSRLPGLVVHEMHHLIRFNIFPFGMQTSVADYIVAEGLAESFAAALFGEQIVGYYVTDISNDDLKIARTLIGENLTVTGFDKIRAYIFGDQNAGQWGWEKIGMPAFGGYAVGYHVVQAYMQRTGKSIEATTFVSGEEICAESGYFDEVFR